MLINWNEDQIRFMEDASRNGTYYRALVDRLEPYLKGIETICDAGCGLGQLAEELGRRGYAATAADSSTDAIRFVQSRHPENVTPLLCDLHTYSCDTTFEAMVFHYFGSMEEILKIGKRLSKGPLLIIKKTYRNHRFSLSEQPIESHSGQSAEMFLTERDIPFRKEDFVCEMGQPFRTLEDAMRFFSLYSSDQDKSLLTKENILSRLEKTDDREFPYYLRQKKSSVILVVEEY